jgi:hypothetical protein
MMHDFKHWKLVESFGEGKETFTSPLDKYGKMRNLYISSAIGWGDVEDATGTLKYTASIDVRKGGIEDIQFTIDEIIVSIVTRVGEDVDNDGEIVTYEYVFNKDNIVTDPDIEIYKMPFYLNSLELDFRQAEDLDGEIDLKKVKITMEIGDAS